MLFFYTGERKNPEDLEDDEWCKRIEQLNWVLRFTGVVQLNEAGVDIMNKEIAEVEKEELNELNGKR